MRNRDAQEQPNRLHLRFFATIMGFALIWHIWWMWPGRSGRLRDLRRLCLA